jgi:hypothetical protein
MKQLLVSGLAIFLLASSTPRPAEVLSVSPPEESKQTHVEYVGAELSPREGEGVTGGSLQFLVDRVDVTNLSTIGNTRDGCLISPECRPPSHAGIIYYTPNGLEPGPHHAELRFQTKEGKEKSYSWTFFVSP